MDRECLRKIPTRLARLPVLPVRFIIDGETDLKKVLPLELHDKINVLRIDEGRKGKFLAFYQSHLRSNISFCFY